MTKFIVASCLKHCVDSHGVKTTVHGRITYWGGLGFSSSPAVHSTKQDAEKEAARLAKENPGIAYIVFQALSSSILPELEVKVTEIK